MTMMQNVLSTRGVWMLVVVVQDLPNSIALSCTVYSGHDPEECVAGDCSAAVLGELHSFCWKEGDMVQTPPSCYSSFWGGEGKGLQVLL